MTRNPYAPPRAPVADLVGEESPGRPVLVTVISFYYGFTAISSLATKYFIINHLNLLPASMRAPFQSIHWFDIAVWLTMSLVKVWAALSLFRLRAHAVVLLAAVLALGMINTLRYIVFKNLLVNTSTAGLVGSALGFILSIIIINYAVGLRAQGILRSVSMTG